MSYFFLMFSALNEYGSDPRSYEYFLGSRENKARTGFELMTSVIPVQRSTSQLGAGH